MKLSMLSRLLFAFYFFLSLTELLAAPITISEGLEVRAQVKKSRSPSPAPGARKSPSPKSSRPSSPAPQSPSPKLDANAQKFINWLNADGKQYSKICFYSGKTGKMAIWQKRSTFEAYFGCQFFQSLRAKAGISESDTQSWRDGLEWTMTSKALASNARGQVNATPGKDYQQEGIWNTVELPVLRAAKTRGDVTSIEGYTMVDEAGKLDGPVQL